MGKRKITLCISLVLMLSMMLPMIVSAKEEPDTYNMKEFRVDQVSTIEEMMTNSLYGGMHPYTSTYAKKIPDGRVKITAKGPGTLALTAMIEEGTLPVYNESNQKIGILDDEDNDELYLANVKTGDVFYVQLPKRIDRLFLMGAVFEDHFTKLFNKRTCIQTGTGSKEYRTFNLTKRSKLAFYMAANDGKTTYYGKIQKYDQGTWKDWTKSFCVSEDNNGCAALGKGSYRLVTSAKAGAIYSLQYQQVNCHKKYKTKRSKAQNISKNTTRDNVFIKVEKKARWYKINKKKYKEDSYITMDGEVNSGKLKMTIYKKGKKKPVKTVRLYGVRRTYFAYKMPKGKGTYYVKVQKIGKDTNGYYEIGYDRY